MRSIWHPEYVHRPWSDERKARASASHRARLGAPEGYATVRGVHVPYEHRAPIRYWSDWMAHHEGEDAARRWVRLLKDRNWSDMPTLWVAYRERKDIAKTREQIRRIQWELTYGNRNNP